MVEIAEVGANWERHEYELDRTTTAPKPCWSAATNPMMREWSLYESFVQIPRRLPARRRRRKSRRTWRQLDGRTSTVAEIFLSTVQQTDGTGLDGLNNGTVSYGFRSVSWLPSVARPLE